MIWTNDGMNWFASIPSGEHQYNSPQLGPFASRDEALAAMDAAWAARK